MTNTTFSAARDKFLRRTGRTKSPETLKNYTRTLSDFSRFCAHRNEIEKSTVEDYADALAARVSPATVSQYLTILRAFFASAVRNGDAADNPAEAVEPPTVPPKEYNLLTKEEIEKIVRSHPNEKHIYVFRDYTVAVTAILCGLRNAELRALTPADVDRESGTIRVQNGKGGKKRSVPAPKTVLNAIDTYLASGFRPSDLSDTAPLFGSTQEGRFKSCLTDAESAILPSERKGKSNPWHAVSGQALNTMLKRYTRRVIGREIHTHLLRHAAASYWDDLGVSMRDVQIALGHASITTTEKVYVSVLNRNRAAATINAAFNANGI